MEHSDALFAGMFAGVAQTGTGHPFDTIKVWNVKHKQTVRQSIFSIREAGGYRHFYRGVMAPMYNGILMNMITYYSYERLRRNHEWSSFTAGAMTGALLTIVESPSDVVKSNMQISKNKGYVQIIKELGPKGMSRGFGITLFRNIPSVGGYFWGYSLVRERIENRYLGGFLGGAMAGFMCWAPTYPLDYIKTRVQTGPESVLDVIKKTKLRGYYRGFGPCIIRSIIVNPFVFLAYEVGLQVFQ